MLMVELISWWYGAGWLLFARSLGKKISSVADTFSIGELLMTLFSPFRQISVAGQVSGPLEAQFRAWLDLLISRGIGAMVRLAVIVVGLLSILVMMCVSLVLMLLWPLLPVAPIVGVVIAIGGGWR